MHPQQTRDRKKALVKRKKPVRVYQRPNVGLKEIKRKGSDLVPRDQPIILLVGQGRYSDPTLSTLKILINPPH
jgi:hypothetical protein